MWELGKKMEGTELWLLKEFLAKTRLSYDEGIEYTFCLLNEEEKIIGTGSAEQNVLKCIAIDPAYQGQGLAATILTHLIAYEFEQGRSHLFLYTKPENREMFEGLSFYSICESDRVLFMENRKKGFIDFLQKIKEESPKEAFDKEKRIGAIVANCNPFTKGHRYLIECACRECDYVHVFVLSDKRSLIPPDVRYDLVKQGTADIKNVILHRASDYIISAATFPTYFMKDKVAAERANCELDVKLFGEKIAPELNISCRYVGTEPGCAVTNVYNETLERILPHCGVELKEIKRLEEDGKYISASAVREYMKNREFDKINQLVPKTTLQYLMEHEI